MLRTVLASVVAVLLVAAPPALAAGARQQILRQCQDGALTGDFTAKEIRDARDNIPTDIDQYSDCRDVLSRALAQLAGGGSGGSGGSGGAGGGTGGGGLGGGSGSGSGGGGGGGSGALLTPSTPADQQALTGASRSGDAPVDVGGTAVVPGSSGLTADAARHSLPTTVLVALALLAAAALAGAVPYARRHAGALRPGGLISLGRRVVPRRH